MSVDRWEEARKQRLKASRDLANQEAQSRLRKWKLQQKRIAEDAARREREETEAREAAELRLAQEEFVARTLEYGAAQSKAAEFLDSAGVLRLEKEKAAADRRDEAEGRGQAAVQVLRAEEERGRAEVEALATIRGQVRRDEKERADQAADLGRQFVERREEALGGTSPMGQGGRGFDVQVSVGEGLVAPSVPLVTRGSVRVSAGCVPPDSGMDARAAASRAMQHTALSQPDPQPPRPTPTPSALGYTEREARLAREGIAILETILVHQRQSAGRDLP
ncbi:hypothetical protein KIPB_001365 [Kipferlia bialata]|uniref:Uncharacterized protein n=1 Tax=Kipferlia bialata TaxID=797122 RepID=A0A391NLT4_9EUKA|nr:hypothetical protein KIPB_001365 [Kipferlia bialata]|eukprot:g1365.t1